MNLREIYMGAHVGGAEYRGSIHLAQFAVVGENGAKSFLVF